MDFDKDKLEKAGKIAQEAVKYARSIVKKDMPLLELADKIEKKIIELGGKPAFPVNLSINEVAAHATPAYDSNEKAYGLLKVDLGVHVNGWIADTAFSVDLENKEENKKMIEAAEKGLRIGIETIRGGVELRIVGKAINEAISGLGFTPIRNLSGHTIAQYNVHAGLTIPNYDNANDDTIEEDLYAIEPFATNGHGMVKDGKLSGIYQLKREGNVRDSSAREVLGYIRKEYKTLPFCSRWIYAWFGTRGLLGLRRIEEAGLLHHYAQLVEISHGLVAQAEHTVLLTGGKKIITT